VRVRGLERSVNGSMGMVNGGMGRSMAQYGWEDGEEDGYLNGSGRGFAAGYFVGGGVNLGDVIS